MVNYFNKYYLGSISLIIILVFFQFGCRTDVQGQYAYTAPSLSDDGIEVGHLADTDLDTTVVFKLLQRIKTNRIKEIHSILIYKDDKLVLEEYFPGHDYNWEQPNFWGPVVQWDRDRLHNIMSDTKSVTSALIGIAIDKGFIGSVEDTVFTYLPDYIQFMNQGRENIQIEHLLTMTSGLEGNEWISSYRELDNAIISLWLCDDPIQCILDRPMVAEPGTRFSYWGGNQILLGEILKNASGMEVHSFAKKHLFEPLGIELSEWPLVNNGPQDAAGGLELTPRSMVKIGITFLNNGEWQGQQVLSKKWIEKSVTPYRNNKEIRVPGEKSWRHGYTYGWWTRSWDKPPLKTYFAGGWGGQNIFVMPEESLVVVFTGGNYTKIPPPKRIMDKYIIPALNTN